MISLPPYMNASHPHAALRHARTALTDIITARDNGDQPSNKAMEQLCTAYRSLSIALINQLVETHGRGKGRVAAFNNVTAQSVEKNDLFKATAFVYAVLENLGYAYDETYTDLPQLLKRHANAQWADAARFLGTAHRPPAPPQESGKLLRLIEN